MLAFNIGQTLLRLWNDSGVNAFFVDDGWKSLVMIAIACVFLYLGIVTVSYTHLTLPTSDLV